MPLPLVLVVLAAGVVMVAAGVADPKGGPLGLIGGLLRGETPRLRPAGDPTSLAGDLTAQSAGKTGGTGGGSGTSSGTGGSGGSAVVAYARKQLGKPYATGGNGPDRFDCSGLVWRAVQAAGLKWPDMTAEGQRSTRNYGKTISASAARPGDIVFFGVPAYHNGIVIGGGQMIHAPHTGDVVKTAPINGVRTGPITYRRFV